MNALAETFRNETRNFGRIVGNDRRMPRAIEVRKKSVRKLRKIVTYRRFNRKKGELYAKKGKAGTENSCSF